MAKATVSPRPWSSFATFLVFSPLSAWSGNLFVSLGLERGTAGRFPAALALIPGGGVGKLFSRDCGVVKAEGFSGIGETGLVVTKLRGPVRRMPVSELVDDWELALRWSTGRRFEATNDAMCFFFTAFFLG